ncbi:hypothetical protein [Fructobacillus tropaeoli]|uniref:Phage protein n=1 Tax=Fructobacillus tropaeoli TaxID=709323 RepID=A0A3F3H606_9LACO|nr:hypothetical protein [Fructobacillus tropaeoli]GAP05017.1 phage protein [Fructobacillus tropaeoli]
MAIFSIIISIFSLIIALTSLFYTWIRSKAKINIVDYQFNEKYDEKRVSFTIYNDSPSAIKIENITFLKNDIMISERKVDTQLRDKIMLQNNLSEILKQKSSTVADFLKDDDKLTPFNPTVLSPYKEMKIKTLVTDQPTKIKVITDKRIRVLYKSKSFVVFNSKN